MSLRKILSLFAFVALLAAPLAAAEAAVVAKISVSRQTMHVYVDGSLRYTWAVSTGRKGYATPHGSFRPKFLKRMHYSRKYDNSPMPHSIFFLGGYAVHGTGYVSQLGRRASHGCVRLAPGNAAALFALVRSHGLGRSRIVITN